MSLVPLRLLKQSLCDEFDRLSAGCVRGRRAEGGWSEGVAVSCERGRGEEGEGRK